jgi:hypothetical protein
VRVVLDECLPRRLGAKLTGHSVSTVPHAGWAGKTNGELLSLIEGKFDVFVTIDKNLPSQQQLGAHSFGVVVLRAASNRLDDLLPLAPELLAALDALKPGDVIRVPAGDRPS